MDTSCKHLNIKIKRDFFETMFGEYVMVMWDECLDCGKKFNYHEESLE